MSYKAPINERNRRKVIRTSTYIKPEYWKQRARIKWDQLGDQPTNFFFKSMKSRKGGKRNKSYQRFNGKLDSGWA